MGAVGALQHDARAGLDVELARLEVGDKLQLLGRELAKAFDRPQRTFFAGHLSPRGRGDGRNCGGSSSGHPALL